MRALHRIYVCILDRLPPQHTIPLRHDNAAYAVQRERSPRTGGSKRPDAQFESPLQH
jgi:hypothetical protein